MSNFQIRSGFPFLTGSIKETCDKQGQDLFPSGSF